MAEHKDIQEPNLHEAKGAASAVEGHAMFATGLGGTEFRPITTDDVEASGGGSFLAGTVSQGCYKYADNTTSGTPIELTLANTEYELTNDAAGVETFEDYALEGLPGVWDETTNSFSWVNGDKLSLGDTLDILVELTLDVGSVNTEVSVYLDLDDGGAPFRLNVGGPHNYKNSGVYDLDVFTPLFMKTQAILDGTAKLYVEADGTGVSVTVRGFFIRVFHTNT